MTVFKMLFLRYLLFISCYSISHKNVDFSIFSMEGAFDLYDKGKGKGKSRRLRKRREDWKETDFPIHASSSYLVLFVEP